MKLTGKHIGWGDDAIYETLREMERLALRDSQNQIIIDLAKKITENCENDLCKSEAIYDYIYKNINYKHDDKIVNDVIPEWKHAQSTEYFTAPIYILEMKKGDCDDMALLGAALSLAIGLQASYKIIAWKSCDKQNAEYTHVYLENLIEDVWEEPYWVPADPVIHEFGTEKAPVCRASVMQVGTNKIEHIIKQGQ